MREISIADFQKMTMEELLKSPCLKVLDVEQVGPPLYLIPHPEGPMRFRVEGVCSQIDAGRGL